MPETACLAGTASAGFADKIGIDRSTRGSLNGLGTEKFVEHSTEMVEIAAHRRAGMARIDVATGRFDTSVGQGSCHRSFSGSLLKMLWDANRPPALERPARVHVAAEIAEIVSDIDPPLVARGRAS